MIRIERISKAFGGLQAVRDVSLEVEPGSITGLIGPNGAGKSTLFNIIAGLIPADTGRIYLEGQDITGRRPHRLFHQGLVRTFQVPHEFARMTVRENLMVVPPAQSGENLLQSWFRWGKVRRQESVVRDRAEDVLEFLSLDHLADERAANLSGGQKKLLDLGRTMMTDARAVLLDEPGAGVNRTLLGKISDAIQRLNRERGYTFFLIEHDMDLIAKLCNPVHVMANGGLIASGPMAEIRENEEVREAYLGGGVSATMGASE